jgi:hypothetical protein
MFPEGARYPPPPLGESSPGFGHYVIESKGSRANELRAQLALSALSELRAGDRAAAAKLLAGLIWRW